MNRDQVMITLFGGPRLRVGERAVPLSSQQRCLIGFVYCQGRGRGVTRSRVIELLWGTRHDGNFRQRLRQLLHNLTKTAGRCVVQTEEQRLRPASGVATDLEVLRDAAAIETRLDDLAGALALELVEPPTRDYADWLIGARHEMATRLKQELFVTWTEAALHGERRLASRLLRVLLDRHPEDPALLASIVDVQARTGEAVGGQRAIAPTHQDQLQLTLRGPYSSKIRLGTSGSSLPYPWSLVHGSGVLIGRDEELSIMSSAIRDAPPGFNAVVLRGESGIGKTHLCLELLRRFDGLGYRVLWSECRRAERAIPFSPLIDALKGLDADSIVADLQDPWRAVAEDVLAMTAGRPTATRGASLGVTSRRQHEGFRLLLEGLSRDSPSILFMDDFHWADESTVAAMGFMSRRWTGGRMTVVLTVRSENEGPGAPYSEATAGSVTYRDVTMIQLEELPLSAAIQLALVTCEHGTTEEDARALIARTGGHPLLITECVADGCLAGPDEKGAREAPEAVRRLLAARLEGASPCLRELLAFLAVSGVQSLSEIGHIARQSPRTLGRVVDEGIRRRLLETTGFGQIRFRHELFQQAMDAEVKPGARAAIHRECAEWLEKTADPSKAGRLAVHYHHAGVRGSAYHFGLQAGRRLVSRGGLCEAIGFLKLARSNAEDEHAVLSLDGKIGHLLFLDGQVNDAAPVLKEAAQKHRQMGWTKAAVKYEIERWAAESEGGSAGQRRCVQGLEAVAEEAALLGEWFLVFKALEAELRALEREDDPDGIRKLLVRVATLRGCGSLEARALAESLLALEAIYGDPKLAFEATQEAVKLARSSSTA